MQEVTYLNKTLNKRITQTFWSKRETYQFVKQVKRDKNLVLLVIQDNSYLYDQYQYYIGIVLKIQYNYIKEVENER